MCVSVYVCVCVRLCLCVCSRHVLSSNCCKTSLRVPDQVDYLSRDKQLAVNVSDGDTDDDDDVVVVEDRRNQKVAQISALICDPAIVKNVLRSRALNQARRV